MNVAVKFEKRDLWVGVFWDTSIQMEPSRPWSDPASDPIRDLRSAAGLVSKKVVRITKIYVCIIPCLPIIFTIQRPWGDWR